MDVAKIINEPTYGILAGVGLTIGGFVLVLKTDRPWNVLGLGMTVVGLAVTGYSAYKMFASNSSAGAQTAEVQTASTPQ